MKKKIFVLLAVICAMLLAVSVSAFAKIYYDVDFSDASVLEDKTKISFTQPKDLASGQIHTVEIVSDDIDVTGDGVPDGTAGTLRMKNTSSQGLELIFVFPTDFKEGSPESVFVYDFMLPDTSTFNMGSTAAMIYYGGVRHNAYFNANRLYSEQGTVQTGHTPGVWYTYMYKLNSDRSKLSIYRKLQSEPESEFKLLGTCGTGAHTRQPAFVWSSNSNVKNDIFFDNLKLYTGANIMEEVFTVDGSEITEISEVAEGELQASISLLSNKEYTGLSKLFVAYDKQGKLLDCTVAEEETATINMGYSEISAIMNLDAEAAAAIADGGYVGLYVWNGMIPVMTPLELQ